MNAPCAGFAVTLAAMLGFVTASGVRWFGAGWWSTVGVGLLVLLAFGGIFYVLLENVLNGGPDERRPAPKRWPETLEATPAWFADLGATVRHARETTQHMRRQP